MRHEHNQWYFDTEHNLTEQQVAEIFATAESAIPADYKNNTITVVTDVIIEEIPQPVPITVHMQ